MQDSSESFANIETWDYMTEKRHQLVLMLQSNEIETLSVKDIICMTSDLVQAQDQPRKHQTRMKFQYMTFAGVQA